MNRERKYRAWDKKRKRMYEVLHLHITIGGIWATVRGFDVIDQKDVHLQIQPKDIEVMDWTGLHDKNGKDIYEGDILKDDKDENNNIGVVYYYAPQFVVQTLEDVPYALAEGKVNLKQLEYTEVIGNIYQHPELLTSAK